MSTNWDLHIEARLWQGSIEPALETGAEKLAELIDSAGRSVVVGGGLGEATREHGVDNFAVLRTFHADAAAALRDAAPRSVLTIGGDCTVEVAPASHLASIYPDMHMVWIDAHADLNTPESSPSGHAHGMPLRMILGDGHPELVAKHPISPDRVMLVGTRPLDDSEQEFIERHDMRMQRVDALRGDRAAFASALEAWLPDGAPLYIHLDLDVLDPEVWPAVAVPEPGGFTLEELESVIEMLRERGTVVGAGVTEYVPHIPHDARVLRRLLDALGVAAA